MFALIAIVLAAPLTLRNLFLYHTIDAQQETMGGAHAGSLLHTALHMPWVKLLRVTMSASLWQGNNSCTSFNAITERLMMMLMLAPAICYAVSAARRPPRAAERVVLSAVFLYTLGLAYNAAILYRDTNGLNLMPSPWHVQLLAPPGFCLLFAGLTRAGIAGRVIRGAICLIWAYVIAVTYWVKLIPLYAGYPASHAHPGELYRWYAGEFPASLPTTALLPPPIILGLAAAVALTAVTLGVRLAFSYPQVAVIPKASGSAGAQ